MYDGDDGHDDDYILLMVRIQSRHRFTTFCRWRKWSSVSVLPPKRTALSEEIVAYRVRDGSIFLPLTRERYIYVHRCLLDGGLPPVSIRKVVQPEAVKRLGGLEVLEPERVRVYLRRHDA
jgi:hypothetical protein